jgi:hypothetical protein
MLSTSILKYICTNKGELMRREEALRILRDSVKPARVGTLWREIAGAIRSCGARFRRPRERCGLVGRI